MKLHAEQSNDRIRLYSIEDADMFNPVYLNVEDIDDLIENLETAKQAAFRYERELHRRFTEARKG